MSTAIEKTDPALLERLANMVQNSGQSSTYDPQLATSFIKWAAQHTNLISPAMACPNLPLGFELAFTKVDINPDPKFKEVYRQSDGGLSLTKVGLEKIQKGAGIRLDPKLTRKLDNGEDPLFAVYEFVGHYRDFDGTICPVKGTKELDLHDDSAEIAKIRSRQKSQTSGDNEINELRRFISGHAESKAKNRGIRSFGIKSSYSDAELQKPFTCIRLIRTGRCDDPIMQRELTLQIHQEYMLAEQSLFGGHSQLTVGKERAALPEVPIARAETSTETAAPMAGFTNDPAPQKECSQDECLGEGAKHAIIKKKDGSTVNLCTGDKTEAPAVETATKTAPVDPPKEMDAMERALSSQLDKFIDLIERGVDEHGMELTPEGVEKIKNDMKVIEGAIQNHRAGKETK